MELLSNECTGSSNFESVKRIKYHMHGMTIIPDVKTFGRKFRRSQDVFQYPRKWNIVCCILEVYWVTTVKLKPSEIPEDGIRGGGGYSIYPWVGRCGPALHTLTLFKTKIADFPTLFKTEFRFLIPCLRHLTRNHTLCKTVINKKFAVV